MRSARARGLGRLPDYFVPIAVHYPPKAERVSHFNPVWDNVRYFFLYTYLNFRHLLCSLPHRRLVANTDPLLGRLVLGHAQERGAQDSRAGRASAGGEALRRPISRIKQLAKYLVHENNTPGELAMAAGIGGSSAARH